MPWVKLDDKFHRNPKVLAMSDGAHRVYTDGLSYCADMILPTGFLATSEAIAFVKSRGKSMKVIAELVDLNAWERTADGYLVHDFEVGMPEKSKDRVRRHREMKRGVTSGNGAVTPDVTPDVTRYPTVTARTRATGARVAPEPEPEPEGLRNAPSTSPTSSAGAQEEPATESPDYVELALGLETLFARTLSADDLTEARSWIVDSAYLTASQMVGRVAAFFDWRISQGLGPPVSVRACRASLRHENAYQADAGGRKPERGKPESIAAILARRQASTSKAGHPVEVADAPPAAPTEPAPAEDWQRGEGAF